jgi:hypothetical protein
LIFGFGRGSQQQLPTDAALFRDLSDSDGVISGDIVEVRHLSQPNDG